MGLYDRIEDFLDQRGLEKKRKKLAERVIGKNFELYHDLTYFHITEVIIYNAQFKSREIYICGDVFFKKRDNSTQRDEPIESLRLKINQFSLYKECSSLWVEKERNQNVNPQLIDKFGMNLRPGNIARGVPPAVKEVTDWAKRHNEDDFI